MHRPPARMPPQLGMRRQHRQHTPPSRGAWLRSPAPNSARQSEFPTSSLTEPPAAQRQLVVQSGCLKLEQAAGQLCRALARQASWCTGPTAPRAASAPCMAGPGSQTLKACLEAGFVSLWQASQRNLGLHSLHAAYMQGLPGGIHHAGPHDSVNSIMMRHA